MNDKVFFCILFLLIGCHSIFASERYLLVTKKTTLRSEANSVGLKMAKLAVNDTLIYLNHCDGYYCKVSFKGKIGWAKKKCFKEIYAATVPSETTLAAAEELPPPMKIEQSDADAWSDLPIVEAKVTEKVSAQEAVFQKVRDLKSAESQTVAVNDYGEDFGREDEWYEEDRVADDEYSTEGGESGGAVYFLVLIIAVIIFNVVRRS
ncbi:MAG: hypothetical protein ACI9XO_003804 [Paraglaciecola sp.]|jgi:hypothetical protein